jgi:hypothetical protein
MFLATARHLGAVVGGEAVAAEGVEEEAEKQDYS